jgi:transposase
LQAMCARLAERHQVEIKIPALWHQLNRWGLSLKKNPARQRARTTGRTASTS